MRPVDSTEILIFLLAGFTGVIGWHIDKWWISSIVYLIGFSLCSCLIGLLKRQVIAELMEKLK